MNPREQGAEAAAEKAAAEKAAERDVVVWNLSAREKNIIKMLSQEK